MKDGTWEAVNGRRRCCKGHVDEKGRTTAGVCSGKAAHTTQGRFHIPCAAHSPSLGTYTDKYRSAPNAMDVLNRSKAQM